MVRSDRAALGLGLWIAALVSGCGANVSSQGHGSGSHGGLASPQPHEISKAELLAAELITAGAITAVEAGLKDCPSMCIAPAVCDRRSGLCKTEAVKAPIVTPTSKPKLDPVSPIEAEPTCEGLCLAGERCVIKDGKQDCVKVGKP
jgi:hypothetical protein